MTVSVPTLTTSKVYDGSTSAVVTAGTLSGVASGDVVTVSASAVYDNENVGTAKTITASYTLGGNDAAKYTAPAPSVITIGVITTKALTVSVPTLTTSKIYDGTTAAIVTAGTLSGVISGDVVTISASAAYDNSNVGTSKMITVSYSLSGSSSANYTVPANYSVATAVISTKALTISIPDLNLSKVYDGTATVVVVTAGTLSGLAPGDDVTVIATATYDNSNVGTGKTITVSYSLSGSSASKYIAPTSYVVITKGTVTPKLLTINATTLNLSKVYDGTTLSTVTAGTLSGIVSGDVVTVIATAVYDNANGGTAKTITVTYSLSGGSASKYLAPVSDVVTTGIITTKALTVSVPTLTASKVYDGTTSAVATTGTLSGVATGDDVSITATSTYDNSNVGTAKTITVSYSLSGSASTNYTAPANYSVATGVITTKALTVSTPTLTSSKVYDGTTAAAVTAGTLSGVVSGDVVTIKATGAYDNSNVGIAKPITVSYSLSGSSSTNYTVPANNTVNTGVISTKALTVSVPTLTTSKVYDGSTAAVVTAGTLSGVATGDNVLATATAVYDNSDAGTVKTITISYSLSGSSSANYTAPDNITNAGIITVKALTVSGAVANDKVYDGADVCTISNATLNGIVNADNVVLNSMTGNFAQIIVGTNIAVTPALTIGGADVNNYVLVQPSNLKANIVVKSLTVTATLIAAKVYDGIDIATITGGSLVGIIAGDNVVLNSLVGNYSQANVGSNLSISTRFTISGTNSANYTIVQPTDLIGSITPKQLTISNSDVVIDKMCDGNTTAVVNAAGILAGVETIDQSNVSVSAIACYDNANEGSNKTITVVYSLTGSALMNYIAPANCLITTAKVSSVIALSTLTSPSSACEGSDLELPYNVLSGTPTQYKFIFDVAAVAAGFKNLDYTTASLGSFGQLPIIIPAGTLYGNYSGMLQMKNQLGVESSLYPFKFTVNISPDSIMKKFNDVLFITNFSNKFISYQWSKNGIEINGATKQYYADPTGGLMGDYSVQVKTVDGNTFTTCTKSYNLASRVNIEVYPNPVKASQTCTVKVSGLTDEELKNAILSIYSAQGVCIYNSSVIQLFNTIPLPNESGLYVGHISTGNDKDYSFKIVVFRK